MHSQLQILKIFQLSLSRSLCRPLISHGLYCQFLCADANLCQCRASMRIILFIQGTLCIFRLNRLLFWGNNSGLSNSICVSQVGHFYPRSIETSALGVCLMPSLPRSTLLKTTFSMGPNGCCTVIKGLALCITSFSYIFDPSVTS